jgi:hypothetical protein
MWTVMVIALESLLLSGGLLPGSPEFRGKDTFQTPRAGGRTTPDEAQPYLGEWSSLVDGPSGQTNFIVKITVNAGKVLATVQSELMGENQVQDIRNTQNGIALRYTGELWGYSTPVVFTVAADGDVLHEEIMIWWFQLRGIGKKSSPH